MRPPKKPWRNFVDALPVIEEDAERWFSIGEFARQIGTTYHYVRNCLANGKIGKRCVAKIVLPNGQHRVVVHAERARKQLGKATRATNKEAQKPKVESGAQEVDIEAAVAAVPTGDMVFEPVVDIASAKYRAEQLRIAKMQAELRLANNEVMRIEDVKTAQQEIAAEVQAALRKAQNKMAPELLKCKTVLEIRNVIAKHHAAALRALLGGDGGDGET